MDKSSLIRLCRHLIWFTIWLLYLVYLVGLKPNYMESPSPQESDFLRQNYYRSREVVVLAVLPCISLVFATKVDPLITE